MYNIVQYSTYDITCLCPSLNQVPRGSITGGLVGNRITSTRDLDVRPILVSPRHVVPGALAISSHSSSDPPGIIMCPLFEGQMLWNRSHMEPWIAHGILNCLRVSGYMSSCLELAPRLSPSPYPGRTAIWFLDPTSPRKEPPLFNHLLQRGLCGQMSSSGNNINNWICLYIYVCK